MTYLNDVDVTVLGPEFVGQPEVTAMLGAFYSRSYKPIKERLAELGSVEAVREKCRDTAVGYGHGSILDMANFAVFVENVPILAAVAFEDHALFAGQETSTRYVDWSTETFCNPQAPHTLQAEALQAAYDLLRSTYTAVQRRVYERLTAAHSADPAAPPLTPIQQRAMRARSFDVARGFLPAGAVTRFAWITRGSAMKKHLRSLCNHPDLTIRIVARQVYEQLHASYPFAFEEPAKFNSRLVDERVVRAAYWPATSRYGAQMVAPSLLYTNPGNAGSPGLLPAYDESVMRACASRRKFDELPPAVNMMAGTFTMDGTIDYGSFRDLNRHRRGQKFLPLPSSDSCLHPWYVKMSELTPRDVDRMNFVVRAYVAMCEDAYDAAYAVPMGTLVPVHYVTDLDQAVYLVERRTTIDVHPTLRMFMQGVGQQLRGWIDRSYSGQPTSRIAVHADQTPDPGMDGYVLVRGGQTFLVRGTQEESA